MKSNREFTDSVYKKYEMALKEEQKRSAARRKTIKYVTTLAACFIIAVGLIGLRLDWWSGIFPGGTNVPDNPAIVQPDNPMPENSSPDGDAQIDDGETPQASPDTVDLEDEDTPTAPSPEADDDDDVMGYAALGGGGACGVGVIAYLLKRRKKRQ